MILNRLDGIPFHGVHHRSNYLRIHDRHVGLSFGRPNARILQIPFGPQQIRQCAQSHLRHRPSLLTLNSLLPRARVAVSTPWFMIMAYRIDSEWQFNVCRTTHKILCPRMLVSLHARIAPARNTPSIRSNTSTSPIARCLLCFLVDEHDEYWHVPINFCLPLFMDVCTMSNTMHW